jgi:hypothetical protein
MASAKIWGVLGKIETTQFTDPTPTGAANAVLAKNLRVNPLNIQNQSRDLVRAYYGNSENIPVMVDSVVDFDVEIAGSGAAGTAPAWGPLMRACAFAQTIVASTSVAYNPVSSGFESITLYCYRGGIRYKLTGCMGKVTGGLTAKGLPTFHFQFVGRAEPITDAAIPSLTLTGWVAPVACIPANTGAVTIGGYAAQINEFSFDIGNEVSHAVWTNAETISITDRKSTGRLSFKLVPVATHDYPAAVLGSSLQAMSYAHGVNAGNIVTFAAPKVQQMNLTEGAFENELTWLSDLTLNPNVGNDELVITCT